MSGEDMTGVILAGGKASRYNHIDKGTLEINGVKLIESAIDCLSRIFPRVIIVTNKPDIYRFPGVQIVEDDVEYLGSLNGLLCGLRATKTLYNFVTACDMPFLREGAIRYLLERERDYDVLSPENGKGLQPLFAIYSRDCIPVIEKRVKKRLLKIQDIFPLLKTKTLSAKEMEAFATGPDPFFNINRPGDLALALNIKG